MTSPNPASVRDWGKQSVHAVSGRYGEKAREEELQSLYAKIGQLTTQNEWLKKKAGL